MSICLAWPGMAGVELQTSGIAQTRRCQEVGRGPIRLGREFDSGASRVRKDLENRMNWRQIRRSLARTWTFPVGGPIRRAPIRIIPSSRRGLSRGDHEFDEAVRGRLLFSAGTPGPGARLAPSLTPKNGSPSQFWRRLSSTRFAPGAPTEIASPQNAWKFALRRLRSYCALAGGPITEGARGSWLGVPGGTGDDDRGTAHRHRCR